MDCNRAEVAEPLGTDMLGLVGTLAPQAWEVALMAYSVALLPMLVVALQRQLGLSEMPVGEPIAFLPPGSFSLAGGA